MYTIEIDDPLDAVRIRDALTREANRLRKAAEKQRDRAGYGYGSGKTRSLDAAAWNDGSADVLERYAAKAEQVRLESAAEISKLLGIE